MARWEPDARGRLEKAAMELFGERGYDQTTVADIAARAELTERTFFRYFADKREVLFAGSAELERTIVEHVAAAPEDLAALDVLVAAYAAAGRWLEDLRSIEHVRARYALVTLHPEVHERELIKLAGLARATAEALVARGVPASTASLAAELGMAVFKLGFERWVTARGGRRFADHIRAALADLKDLAAPRRASPPPRRPRSRDR